MSYKYDLCHSFDRLEIRWQSVCFSGMFGRNVIENLAWVLNAYFYGRRRIKKISNLLQIFFKFFGLTYIKYFFFFNSFFYTLEKQGFIMNREIWVWVAQWYMSSSDYVLRQKAYRVILLYVRRIFQKTNISYALIRTRTFTS